MVEGGHVEQVELEGGGLPHGDHHVPGPGGEVELPPHILRLQLQQLVLRPTELLKLEYKQHSPKQFF